MPRLDLAKHFVSSLLIRWSVPATSEADSIFSSLLEEDAAFLKMVAYSRGKVPHLRYELVTRVPEDNEFGVSVRYEANGERPLGSVPKALQRQGEVLDRLMAAGPPDRAHSHVELEYPDASHLQTVFPLPFVMSPPGEYSLPLDEIRGVRGVKLGEEGSQDSGYSFILDRPENESIWLSLDFGGSPSSADAAPRRGTHDRGWHRGQNRTKELEISVGNLSIATVPTSARRSTRGRTRRYWIRDTRSAGFEFSDFLDMPGGNDWGGAPARKGPPRHIVKVRRAAAPRSSEQELVEAYFNERLEVLLLQWKVASLERQLEEERGLRLALERQIEGASLETSRSDGGVYAFGRPISERPIKLRIIRREEGAPFIGDDDLVF